MKRLLLRAGAFGFAALITINIVFAMLISFPGWAFAHSDGTDRLQIHSPEPLPPETRGFAAQIMAALDQSALPPGDTPIDVYITGPGWREALFFAAAPGAGGLVYGLVPNRKVFLSGADILSDRLLKGDVVITPPRTLTYYFVHEIAHVSQIDRYGLIDYHRMPKVIREGVADYLALGPVSDAVRCDVAAQDPDASRLDLMIAHGAYPEYRLAVSDMIEDGDVVALMDKSLGK